MMLQDYPWLVWSWYFAHRLELACKDAITGNTFKEIKDMLLRLYYLYEMSAKKVRELMDIINELKEVFELPPEENIPIRSHGSRWISHKREALQHLIDRFGAYVSHLTALAEDSSVRSDDKARLKGYLKKWVQFKVVYGCALSIDVLKAPCILSLSLQDKNLDIAAGSIPLH